MIECEDCGQVLIWRDGHWVAEDSGEADCPARYYGAHTPERA